MSTPELEVAEVPEQGSRLEYWWSLYSGNERLEKSFAGVSFGVASAEIVVSS
jgi:hypothetical protein